MLSNVSNHFSRAFGTIRRKIRKQKSHAKMPKDLHIGNIDSGDDLGEALHQSAISDDHRKLKTLLDKGMPVDYTNDAGQTPLFVACAASRENAASILLQYGANPNFQDDNGVAPLLVVCYTGSIGLLCKMVEAGGNLNLRDYQGLGILEWAKKNEDFQSQNAMIGFLQQTRIYGLLSCAQDNDNLCDSRIPTFSTRPLKKTSIMELVAKATGSDISLLSQQSTGYGQVYPCAKDSAAIVAVVPLISEMMLMSVENISFECSLDFTMREMVWLTTEVSVKMLKSEYEIQERAKLILKEASFLSKLRHPNIILLMALCQPSTLDMLTLVFEKVPRHNLYQYLHEDGNSLNHVECLTMGLQLCSALGYIHNQGFIHCGLSSMAVYLSSDLTVKLGNFEFMMESSEADKGITSSIITQMDVSRLYYWMSPELVGGNPPTVNCDVFSFSCVFWEMFSAVVPWTWLSKKALVERAYGAKPALLSMLSIPKSVKVVIEAGLRRKGSVPSMISIYTHLRDLKDRSNVSQNASLKDDMTSMSSREKSSPKNESAQDNLIFPSSKSVKTHGRNYTSTSAIPDEKDTNESARFNKNSSEGDLLKLQNEMANPPAIKPASHQQQPDLAVKTSVGLGGPNINLGEKRSLSVSWGSDQPSCKDDEEHHFVNPMCVKQLAEGYQQIITQHNLRQAILKGSREPQGGSQEEESLLNQSKWHSLPSTIKELSKTFWSPEMESTKAGLSDFGNLSNTPNSKKKTSTPMRRDTERGPPSRGIGLMDFFKRQRFVRDVGISCKLEDTTDVDENMEMHSTSDQETTLLQELKAAQVQWKRLESNEQEQSRLGVSYHSPLIEPRDEKTSASDYFEGSYVEKEESSNICCATKSTMNSSKHFDYDNGLKLNQKTEEIVSNKVKKEDRVLELHISNNELLKNFHFMRKPNVKYTDLVANAQLGAATEVNDENEKGDVETENPTQESHLIHSKDSFWDVAVSLPRNLSSVNTSETKNDKTFSQNENFGTSGHQIGDGLEVEEMPLDHNMEDYLAEDVPGGEMSLRVEQGNGDASPKACGDLETLGFKETLNTTFTFEAPETNSLFPESTSSPGISDWVSDQLLTVQQQMKSSDYIDGKDCMSLRSSFESLPNGSSENLLNIVSDIPEVKCVEFEFQEFYIDDDLDSCDKAESTIAHTEYLDCNTKCCTSPLPSAQIPMAVKSCDTDASDTVMMDRQYNCKVWNNRFDLTKSNISGKTSCKDAETSGVEREMSYMLLSDADKLLPVKDKIRLFEGGFVEESNAADTETVKSENEEINFSSSSTPNRVTVKCDQERTAVKSCSKARPDTHIKNIQWEVTALKQSKTRLIPKTSTTQTEEEKLRNGLSVNEDRHCDVKLKDKKAKLSKSEIQEEMERRFQMQRLKQSECSHDELKREKDDVKLENKNQTHDRQEYDGRIGIDSDADNKTDGDSDRYKEGESEKQHIANGIEQTNQYNWRKYFVNQPLLDSDSDDSYSNHWVNEKLRRVRAKLSRRRHRIPYTVSSEEKADDFKRESLIQSKNLHQNCEESDKSSSKIDSFDLPQSEIRRLHSDDTLDRRSLPSIKTGLSLFSKDENEEEKRPNCKSSLGSRQSKEDFCWCEQTHDTSMRNSISNSNLSCKKDGPYYLSDFYPATKCTKSLRGNESRSSIKTVMFEDKADGLKELSSTVVPLTSPHHYNSFIPTPKPRIRRMRRGEKHHKGYRVEAKKENFLSSEQGIQSSQDDVEDLVVTDQLDFADQKFEYPHSYLVSKEERKPGYSRRPAHSDRMTRVCEQDVCCVTLGLAHGSSSQDCQDIPAQDQMCVLDDNVYNEVHRFYIPRENWPDGCKTQLHMNSCPRNPWMHQITTTAIDPVSGRKEVLIEKTVESDSLRSHLSME